MADLENSFLRISATFGCVRQRVSSARYHWDSSQRGEEQYVILQRTISGEGVFTWEGRNWPVPPEHAFVSLVPEQSSYHYPGSAAEPWVFSWLNLYGPLAAMLFRDLRQMHGPVLPLPRRSQAAAAFEHLTAQAAKRDILEPHDASLACYAFLMEWSKQLKPSHKKADPAETITRICQARFREPLSIKELATETGISREHLTRIFTDRTGISPARYLRDLRVRAARQMMETDNLPLKEVAMRCGFVSPRALNRALAGGRYSPRPVPDSGRPQARATRRPASRGRR